MSSISKAPLNGGYVSTGTGARDASDLGPGELTKMSGSYYRKNDPNQAWKMPGRSVFGDAGSGGIKGISICQFDEGGTDRLVASIGTTLVSAVPGLTGTFTSLYTGLNALSTVLTAAQQQDRWFLGNGYDKNLTLTSDGTIRSMSMIAPTGQPTAVPGALVAESVERPTANVVIQGGWSNPTLAYDVDPTASTFSSITIPVTPDQNWIHKWYGFISNTTTGRTLRVNWGATTIGTASTFALEYSEDGGLTWDDMYESALAGNATIPATWTEVLLVADSALVQVRARAASPVFESGTTVRIYDIQIKYGSAGAVTTTDGIYYATTEFLAATDGGLDLESPPSPLSGIVTLSSNGSVTITRPAVVNPAATHWRVYRVGDGVTPTLSNYGFVSGDILISDTTWVDTLDDPPITEQATPIIPLVEVGGLPFVRDTPAPAFISMIAWHGSIVGISRTFPRSLYYSELGRPESFPEIYVVTSFPLDEHDILVGQMAVGETLVILCQSAILAIDDLPRITDGVYNNADARPLKGHPGCVGRYAYTTFSVAGEPRGAWVSPFGVYVTNGTICACISTDLAWEDEVNVPFLETAVLKWDAKNLILWFEFDLDGDGLNDREMPFHMAEAHSKGESKPKLGQPTEKATSCMASGLIESAYYRYTGHPSDGNVYVEEVGTVDASTSEEVVQRVKTSQLGRGKVDIAVVKVTVGHSDYGDGATGTITATSYRDSANTQVSREQSLRLDGNRGTTIGIGRAGELFDFEIVYSGSGAGGLGSIDLEVDGQGRSGSAPRVSSSSATP